MYHKEGIYCAVSTVLTWVRVRDPNSTLVREIGATTTSTVLFYTLSAARAPDRIQI